MSTRPRTAYAMRIVRGMLLKGNDVSATLPELLPIIGLTLVVVAVAAWLYRETLD